MSLSIKSQPIATLAIADVRSDNNFPSRLLTAYWIVSGRH